MEITEYLAAKAANALRISAALVELQSAWAEKADLDLIIPEPDRRVWRLTLPATDADHWVKCVEGVMYAGPLATFLNGLGTFGTEVQPETTGDYMATVKGAYRPAAVAVVMVQRFDGEETEQAPVDLHWEEV